MDLSKAESIKTGSGSTVHRVKGASGTVFWEDWTLTSASPLSVTAAKSGSYYNVILTNPNSDYKIDYYAKDSLGNEFTGSVSSNSSKTINTLVTTGSITIKSYNHYGASSSQTKVLK